MPGIANQPINLSPINSIQCKFAGFEKEEEEDAQHIQRKTVQRKCAKCEHDELQRKQSGNENGNAGAAVEQTLYSPEQPLDNSTRLFLFWGSKQVVIFYYSSGFS